MKRISILFVTMLLVSTGASAQVFVEGSLAHDLLVQPGRTYDGTIEVGNAGSESESVRVYQTDYLFNAQGESSYPEAGSAPRSNSGWISFFPSELSVPGNGSAAITYRISVPDDSRLTGSYWSMLMVESVHREASNSSGRDSSHPIGIKQLLRYGVQIVTNVGGTGTRSLAIIGAHIEKSKQGVLLLLDVSNTGDRMVIPNVSAEIFAADGSKSTVVVAVSRRVFPATSVRYELDLASLRSGEYRMLILMDAGGEDIFGASYTIRI